jgi:4-hydroxy-2-oxoheptanedioate aldolase
MAYMEHNRVLEKMRAGEFAFGFQLRTRSPLIAELAGFLGFDFLYIETEHFACNDETVEYLVRAAQLSGITPWIRVTNVDPENIGHLLDIGVQGVIAPHVDTPEEARRLVDAVKFAPLGHRGHAMVSRAAEFGTFLKPAEYLEAANRNCSAIAMIESGKGVENLEAILDQGIEIIRVGRGDLSLDTGFFGKQKDPRFEDMLRHICAVAKAKGVPCGTSATDVETTLYYKSLGFTFVNLVSDLEYLRRTIPPLLQSARDAVK